MKVFKTGLSAMNTFTPSDLETLHYLHLTNFKLTQSDSWSEQLQVYVDCEVICQPAHSSPTRVAKTTNDVRIITLPSGRGQLAIAVVVSESKLPDAAQEKLIAEMARASYDAYAMDPSKLVQ